MAAKRKKIGLALGSGGLKGFAHVGVIKALEENNIPIDFIAGSSIGALAGGLYAANKDIKQLEEIILTTDVKKVLELLDLRLSKGFLRGRKIEEFINHYLYHKNFDDLKIPLAVVATNLRTGEAEIIRSGDLSSAIRASISVPVIFQPFKREGKLLIDGGMTMPIPIRALKQMGADIVIAVNLYNAFERPKRFSKISMSLIGNEALEIMLYQITKRDIVEADVVIAPDVDGYNVPKALKQRQKIFHLGEEAAREKIDLIKKLIG